ncbi:MAG TPA: Spx/MgsR family RNA polymerase-binding regulatory protein, partial [Ferruginibacter sp.]|nr:Spx/MgsR family RNA polymerase-binding regulatory protein [Ferruginibacter sp.]
MGKTILYGIPNCDTTKKAINWLSKNKIPYSFHDYKHEGISKEKLQAWFAKEGREKIFNKRSTTWKELPAVVQNKVTDDGSAIKIMIAHNSIIKRPVIEHDDTLLIGFN